MVQYFSRPQLTPSQQNLSKGNPLSCGRRSICYHPLLESMKCLKDRKCSCNCWHLHISKIKFAFDAWNRMWYLIFLGLMFQVSVQVENVDFKNFQCKLVNLKWVEFVVLFILKDFKMIGIFLNWKLWFGTQKIPCRINTLISFLL